jgi:hypothetical protein
MSLGRTDFKSKASIVDPKFMLNFVNNTIFIVSSCFKKLLQPQEQSFSLYYKFLDTEPEGQLRKNRQYYLKKGFKNQY